MSPLELAHLNLTTPAVLAFVLGVAAARLRSDVRFPEALTAGLSIYLLLAIGLKGGVALADTPLGDIAAPALATLALGVVTPLVAFGVLRRLGRFSVIDSAAIAAHYGSVSAVTFTAAVVFVEELGQPTEGFLPALVALLEVPGILVALALAQRATAGTSVGEAVGEVLRGKSIVLLVGGIAIGWVAGPDAFAPVEPLFVGLFPGLLALFLLDLGIVAGERLSDVRKAGVFLVAFAVVAPIPLGAAGVVAGTLSGLSVGGAAVLGAMAASASYIAAPAAVRTALPGANPALSLTAALALTFPFNLVVGIPLYYEMAFLVG